MGDPVWNHVELMDGYNPGDDLEVLVFDDDENDDAEQGDPLGGMTLSAEKFWPTGMKPKEFALENAGSKDANIRLEIVVQKGGEPAPNLTLVMKAKREKSTVDKKDKKEKKEKKKKKKKKKKKGGKKKKKKKKKSKQRKEKDEKKKRKKRTEGKRKEGSKEK